MSGYAAVRVLLRQVKPNYLIHASVCVCVRARARACVRVCVFMCVHAGRASSLDFLTQMANRSGKLRKVTVSLAQCTCARTMYSLHCAVTRVAGRQLGSKGLVPMELFNCNFSSFVP